MAKQYEVLAGAYGHKYRQGDIISADDLYDKSAGEADLLVENGTLREVSAKDAKAAQKADEAEGDPGSVENTTGDMKFAESEFQAEHPEVAAEMGAPATEKQGKK